MALSLALGLTIVAGIPKAHNREPRQFQDDHCMLPLEQADEQ
jgi:hypothetical protein